MRSFTLIEILIALSIFSVMMFGIYHVFSTGLSTWEKAGESMDIHQKARQTLEFISKEIRSSFLSPREEEIKFIGRDKKEEEIDQDELTFFTLFSPHSREEMGIARIVYTLEKDLNSEKYSLLRKETSAIGKSIFAKEKSQIILSDVAGFNLRYLNPDNEWKNEWDSSEALPERVKIDLALRGKNGEEKKFSLLTNIPVNEI